MMDGDWVSGRVWGESVDRFVTGCESFVRGCLLVVGCFWLMVSFLATLPVGIPALAVSVWVKEFLVGAGVSFGGASVGALVVFLVAVAPAYWFLAWGYERPRER